jgi:hypothetical protein
MYIYLYFCVFSINQQNYHLIIKLKPFFFRCMADPDKDRVLKKTENVLKYIFNMNKLNYIYIIKVSHIAVNK